MGAGKTTVGKQLASLLGMDFVDCDNEIERRTGVDIAFIFEKEGEAGFRKRERDVIAQISGREQVVMATGGGAVLDADNRRDLSARGVVIYLYATVEQQLQRTRHSKNRPLLETEDREARLSELFEQRDPLYREVADIVMPTDERPASHLAQRILEKLNSLVPE